MRHIILLLLLLLTLASCVPKSAADQAKAFNERTGGQVDGSLNPIGDRGGYAQSPQDGHGLDLHDASGGQLCVRQDGSDRIWFKATAESLTAGRQRYAGQVVVAVGAYDSLDKFGKGPDKSSGIPGKLAKAKAKEDFNEAGAGTGSMWLDYVLEWCAPLPAIASTTRYLTVTKWAPDHEHPAVFIWKIKGTPTATTGPSTPMTPTTAPSTKPSMPAPAESSGGTALELLRAEGFEKFLQLAAAAGNEQDLAKGNLTIIAVYDSGLAGSKFDAVLADKQRAAALFADSVSDGMVTKQQLIDKKSVTITMRSGRKVVLGFDEKKSRPTLDGKKIERKVFEGSSWVVFTTFDVNLP